MKIKKVGDTNILRFRCPGCKQTHDVNTTWNFNGDFEKPTLQPSVLVKAGHYCPGQEGKDCWCTYEERLGEKPHFSCYICHSFVTDGKIQFLSDCTHALAGQTVDLEDID